jgi:hypothetical protein
MAVTTPIPQAARRLPAVHPDVTKTLTIVALCKPVLRFTIFDLYKYVTECFQFEDFLFLARVTRKRGREDVWQSSVLN